jgi:hypothetical protein
VRIHAVQTRTIAIASAWRAGVGRSKRRLDRHDLITAPAVSRLVHADGTPTVWWAFVGIVLPGGLVLLSIITAAIL